MDNAIKKVRCDNRMIYVTLDNGEVLAQRLEIYPILFFATQDQRNDFYVWDQGRSIRWEEIDEDICIEDLMEKDSVNYNNEVNELLSKFPFLDLKEFANYVGMHWTKLARFKFGVWAPSKKEFDSIKEGLHSIANELLAVV